MNIFDEELEDKQPNGTLVDAGYFAETKPVFL